MSAWTDLEAEKAFGRAARARRRAAVACRLRRRACGCGRLTVHDPHVPGRRAAAARSGLREIALDAITGTIEPNRAAQFDGEFRPARGWQSVWIAAHRGVTLPAISVVAVGDAYAIRDGHHRVSVAKARGAVTINAIVAAA